MSKTFCVMPFTHINIKQKGKLSACWRYPDWIGDYTQETLVEAWNNKNMRELRRGLLSDERPEGCRSCWDLEKSGVTSTRQAQNTEFSNITESVVRRAMSDDFSMPIENLSCIEVRFDNVCNLMCRHCSSDYSSKWETAVKKDSSLRAAMIDAGTYKAWDNPRKLTDGLIAEIGKLSENINYIMISGGEPLYHDKHYDFLEKISHNAKNIKLSYNSNLTTLTYKNKSIIDLWKKFKKISLRVSIDAEPSIYEYVRVHSDLPKVESNIDVLNNELDNLYLSTTCTASVLNITRLPKIFEYFNSIGGNIHTSIVQYPDSLNPRILPKELKEDVTNAWNTWLSTVDENIRKTAHCTIHIDNQIKCAKRYGNYVIDYMNSCDHHDNWPAFKKYIEIMDTYHNTDILDVYPEFKQYW